MGVQTVEGRGAGEDRTLRLPFLVGCSLVPELSHKSPAKIRRYIYRPLLPLLRGPNSWAWAAGSDCSFLILHSELRSHPGNPQALTGPPAAQLGARKGLMAQNTPPGLVPTNLGSRQLRDSGLSAESWR